MCYSLVTFVFEGPSKEVWIENELFTYYGEIDDEEKPCGDGIAMRMNHGILNFSTSCSRYFTAD